MYEGCRVPLCPVLFQLSPQGSPVTAAAGGTGRWLLFSVPGTMLFVLHDYLILIF